MKEISIAQRYLPFSHRPGVRCLLPFSTYGLRVFPTRLCFFDMLQTSSPSLGEIELQHCGPIEDFIVTLDLEKGKVIVAGKNTEGYFRFHLGMIDGRATFCLEKGSLSLGASSFDVLVLPSNEKKLLNYQLSSLERLSLGSHKKQDEELIRRRNDMADIIPLWHRLGLLLPKLPSAPFSGIASLFNEVGIGTPNDYLSPFCRLWKAGIDGLFFPRLEDDYSQGIPYPPLEKNASLSPLSLLSEGSLFIRSLFIQASGKEISILPHLPKEFHCGRMTDIELDSASISIEWSKKEIRRLLVTPKENGEFSFSYPHMKTFRLRSSKADRGERLLTKEILNLEADRKYSFDNFEN